MEEKKESKETGKICKMLLRIESVIVELRKEVLPELKEKLKPVIYVLPGDDRAGDKSLVQEGSQLLITLEGFRASLIDISRTLLDDIIKPIEL